MLASEILHIFIQERAGQFRGITQFAAVMLKMRDFDDFEDAQLLRQKIAACFTAFIHDIDSAADPALSADEDEICEKFEPGAIEVLPPGKTITLANPPGVSNYKEYTSVVLHSIASGLGITYESLVSDLSEVNFSSARLGKTQMNRNIDSIRDDIIIRQFIKKVAVWFLNISEVLGSPVNGAQIKNIPPRKEFVDPTKEIPATIDAMRAGLSTWSETVASLGNDPVEQLEQLDRDNKEFDRLKLTLDSDARKIAKNGKTHTPEIANDQFGLIVEPTPATPPTVPEGEDD